jgi:hypothetical protein
MGALFSSLMANVSVPVLLDIVEQIVGLLMLLNHVQLISKVKLV